MNENLLDSLQSKLQYRQDLENKVIWSATDIYLSKIFLGNGYDASNYQQLVSHKITHVINCTNDIPNYFEDDQQLSLTYIKLDILDFGTDQGISRVFPMVTHLVRNILNETKDVSENGNGNENESNDKNENEGNGNRILLHCANGSNRSVTVAIALLMVLNGRHSFPFRFLSF